MKTNESRKIIATMATYRKRIYSIVWDAARSLASQVDELIINVNPPLEELERWRVERMVETLNEQYPARVRAVYMEQDLGDLAKFHPLRHYITSHIKAYDVVLICDDDIIYPPDYARTMRDHIVQRDAPAVGQEVIISLGGKVLSGASTFSNFRGSWKQRIGFFEPVPGDTIIDLPLTAGVAIMGHHLGYGFDIDLRFRNKGDILLAKYCLQNDIAICCPPKQVEWCRYNPAMGQAETIWSTMLANPQQEREIAGLLNEIFRNQETTKP